MRETTKITLNEMKHINIALFLSFAIENISYTILVLFYEKQTVVHPESYLEIELTLELDTVVCV